MPAICDSSPLILYAAIGRLDLLRDVFTHLLIPTAVHAEVVGAGRGRPGAREVESAPWVEVRAVGSVAASSAPLPDLGLGEAEVILLAVELGGHVPVLLDDRRARELARAAALRVFGSAGILVLARRRGRIAAVAPVLQELRAAGLYLGEEATQELLRSVGE